MNELEELQELQSLGRYADELRKCHVGQTIKDVSIQLGSNGLHYFRFDMTDGSFLEWHTSLYHRSGKERNAGAVR